MLTFTGIIPKTPKNHTIPIKIEDFDQSKRNNGSPRQSLSRVPFDIKINFLTRKNKNNDDCQWRPKVIDSTFESQCRSVRIGKSLKLKFGVKGLVNDPL